MEQERDDADNFPSTKISRKIVHGTIVSDNLQYTQSSYNEVSKMKKNTKTLYAWKGDIAISQIVVLSKKNNLTLSLKASNFIFESSVIPASNVSMYFIKSTKAYTGIAGYGSNDDNCTQWKDESKKKESADILCNDSKTQVSENSVCPIWISIKVPKEIASGTYKGKIAVEVSGESGALLFDYNLIVQEATLQNKFDFDIELWQYPYSSAEYYDVKPFSAEHLEILTPIMIKYKEIGGSAITATISEDAWNKQTYSKMQVGKNYPTKEKVENKIHYPSMIRWEKKNGVMTYDFSDFDTWVKFCKTLGLGKKIVLYSIATWHNSFTYWEDGKLKTESFINGDDAKNYKDNYKKTWQHFLEELSKHLDSEGWFESCYIGIDERGITETAIDLAKETYNGKIFKVASAIDKIADESLFTLAKEKIDDLTIGDSVVQNNKINFESLLNARKAKENFKTTLYSCTGHVPGNFSLSNPCESYWSILFAYKYGTKGFLRWAYDAWSENPLEDASHWSFESGDCFLIYPDKNNVSSPKALSSLRLEKMAQGVRDVNKLIQLKQIKPESSSKIEKLLCNIKDTYENTAYDMTNGQGKYYYLTEKGKRNLVADVEKVREEIAMLSKEL